MERRLFSGQTFALELLEFDFELITIRKFFGYTSNGTLRNRDFWRVVGIVVVGAGDGAWEGGV